MRRVNRGKHITIVGGGLAGLTLGIGLRRRDIPVTICEMGHYPRHRVCGEFVSGRGQEVLNRLGLLDALAQAGAASARTARFFLGRATSPERLVQPPALCLSRYHLDRILAECFRTERGELRENCRWLGNADEEGLVWAGGRRVQPVEKGWRWFGLKIHARSVALGSDLEMHGIRQGYVGLCRLPGGEVNVCGLFRSRPPNQAVAPGVRDLLKGEPGTALYERLARAEFDEGSFCAVAGLPLRPQRACEQQGCRLGDALTMIPPVTGNGMSMAFEAAEIALEPLAQYARGQLSWQQVREAVARDCDKTFRTRLAWAKWVQAMMFTSPLQGAMGKLALRSAWLWRLLFTKTR